MTPALHPKIHNKAKAASAGSRGWMGKSGTSAKAAIRTHTRALPTMSVTRNPAVSAWAHAGLVDGSVWLVGIGAVVVARIAGRAVSTGIVVGIGSGKRASDDGSGERRTPDPVREVAVPVVAAAVVAVAGMVVLAGGGGDGGGDKDGGGGG